MQVENIAPDERAALLKRLVAGELPDARGRFGPFGGRYAPETLIPALERLEAGMRRFLKDPEFQSELGRELRDWVGRPTALSHAPTLSSRWGASVYLKREDLAHTGAHKINNALGQALLAKRLGAQRVIAGIELPMPGRHNVQNALGAIGVAIEMGIPDAVIAKGFEHFGGVKRRFTKVGEIEGATIIDDYGHHPVEIKAVLAAAREGAEGRVIAVVQPHRFTRLRDLMDDFQAAFNDADIVYVTPVYTAGEEPIEGVDAEALVTGLKQRGHRAVCAVDSAQDLARQLRDVAAHGDMVICLGAGDITKWAAGLAEGILQARLSK